jgi:hypothetical protein
MFDSHPVRIVATADQDIFIYITAGLKQASVSIKTLKKDESVC